ncbi:MAG TPA: chromosome segregation protein SMC [archaeon]|nr:chromosome segregation protein SMC [archaeon]
MNLKSIDILGFKSFANRMKLEFPEGITGIVGPNGCGKTNIIEAVRWVLGEQNIRTLRGERMEEVIFNGTAERKPVGMAEVRLSFLDPEHRMGLEVDEFVIGRQVFRSGESNYYINGKVCRLKDIQDLFMDTGMGSNAYSMIEQRMVEAVLSDKAEERRFLFEEAAGIMKYKLRRKYALRKLEATEGDLQRINDIVGEVQRTVGSLSRQVTKARRFQKLREKLRRVAVTLAREELARLENAEESMLSRLTELKSELVRITAQQDTQAASGEEIRTRINDCQRGADELFNRLELVNGAIRRAEDELTVSKEKKAHGKEWIASSTERLENRKIGIVQRQEELKNYAQQVEDLRSGAAESERDYSSAGKTAAEKKSIVEQARAAIVSAQATREELVGRVFSFNSKAETFENSAASQKKRAAELEALGAKFGESLAAVGEELSGLAENLNTRQMERENLAVSLEEQVELLSNARLRYEGLKEQLARARIERDGLIGEKQLLDRLQREMEGFGEGVRSLFLEKQRSDGLEAVAAEVFTAERRFERAVEAALGMRIQSVITRDTGSMLEAIARLKKSGTGSATFISRDMVNGYGIQNKKIEEPVLAYCDEVVVCEKEYEFLRQLLFSGVAIVEDLETAIELQKKTKRPLHLVTLTGETLYQYAVSGGSETDKDSGATLLKRRRRVKEIASGIQDLSSRIEGLEKEISEAWEQVEQLERENRDSQDELSRVEEDLESLRAEKTRLSLERDSLLSRQKTARDEAAEASARCEELAAQRDEVVAAVVEARERLTECESQIARTRALLSAREEEAMASARVLQEVSLRLTEQKARLSELEKSFSLMERECANVTAEAERLALEIEERKAGLVMLDKREKEVRAGLEESFKERRELLARKGKYEEELSELQGTLAVIEESLRDIRKKRETATEARHEIELELERISARRGLVVQQVADNYEIDISALDDDFPFFPSEEERQKGEEADTALVEELQAQIRRLGPVNVLALEEYDREKERLDFLKQQRDDLNDARESLLHLIDEINKTARQRFLGTFAKVQDNFQNIFSSLFEGGQAHVSLVDEDNPLESPIEVSARPRGKKMLGLNLLSGGEKALTALALLFAIYSVKPSPFCILDEVDAPLDDANIDRFLSIIHTFSQNTQFVIVTHNKRTMEAAHCLYGVTMEEPGVSKVVSVRLDQVEEDGEIRYDEVEKKAG